MSQANYVGDNPRYPPGRCAVSGLTGELIDLGMWGREVHPRQHLYVSVKALSAALKDAGWVQRSEVEKVLEEAEELGKEVERLWTVEEKYTTLVGAVKEHIEPEVVVKEVHKVTTLKPTDEDIEEWALRNPDHPILRQHRPPEPGSVEKYRQVYGRTEEQVAPSDKRRRVTEEKMQERGMMGKAIKKKGKKKVEREEIKGGPPNTYTIHGQIVNIDELLVGNVDDIVKFVEGHEGGFVQAVIDREVFVREKLGEKVRVTLIDKLGKLLPSGEDEE